ncbi:MAG: PQQ-binding-like beta-propeller repeat protein [Pirellulaceae bacterium]
MAEISADPAIITDSPALNFDPADWPQWRGPGGNGVALPQTIPGDWSEARNIAWQVDVPGRGHSSPTLAGDLVVVATATSVPEQRQMVMAFDRRSGKQRWKTIVHTGGFPEARKSHLASSNANSTVAFDGDRFLVTFLNSNKIFLTALNLAGDQLWQTEVGEFGSKYGYAPSPMLYKSVVIVAADNWGGGYLAAVDLQSGEILWRKKRPAVATYSSPLIANIDGRDQLVISGCGKIASFDPTTGENLWAARASTEATCGTPVTDGKNVFASGGFPGQQTACVRGNGSGTVVWTNHVKVYEPSMLVHDGHVYAVTADGIGYCWSASDGSEHWKVRMEGEVRASPVLCGELILVPNLSGEVVVFLATDDAYKEVARHKLGDDIHASPAVAGGDLVIRVGIGAGQGRQERLVCIR